VHLRRLVQRLRTRSGIALLLAIGAAALVVPTLAGAFSAPVISSPIVDGVVLGPGWDGTIPYTADTSGVANFTLYRDPFSSSCSPTPTNDVDIESYSSGPVPVLTDSAPADGDWCYIVESDDGAGTVADSDPVHVVYDSTAPTAPGSFALADSNTTRNTDPSFTFSASSDATTVTYELWRGSVDTGISTTTAGTISDTSLASNGSDDGTHSYTLVPTDAAGNVGAPSSPVTVTTDFTAPTAPGSFHLVGGATQSTDPSFTFSASSDTTTVTYELWRGSVDTGISTTTAGTITDTSLPGNGSDDGSHSYTLVPTDAAGNVGTASSPATVTTDFTAPAAPTNLQLVGAATRKTRPSFTFDTSTDTNGPVTYTLLRDGNPTGDTSTSGTISDSSAGLLNGTHDGTRSYSVTASDAASPANVSAPSTAVSVTLDTIAPTTPGSFVLSDSATDRNTDPTFTFTASTDASAITYELWRDGSDTGISTTTAGSITDTTLRSNGLDDGSHTYTLVADDAVGNSSVAAAGVVVRTDFTRPTAPTTLGFTDATSPTRTKPTITFHASTEATSEPVTYELFRNSSDTGLHVTTAASTSSIQDTSLPTDGSADGVETYTLLATDNAGNQALAASASESITYDSTAPAAPTGVAAVSTTTNVHPSFTFTRSTDPSTPITYTLFRNGVTTGITTQATTGAITDTTLAMTSGTDGTYSYTIVATDGVGNASAPSSGVSVTTDDTPPAVPTGLALHNTPTITNTPPSFTFTTTTDAHGPVTYTLYRDTVATATTSTTGTISDSTLPLSSASDGLHSYTLVAADSLGNASIASGAVTVTTDFTPPAAPTSFLRTSPATTNAAPAFSFVASTDPHGPVTYQLIRTDTRTSVTVNAGVTPVGSTITDTSLPLDGSADDPYSYTLRAVDAPGNVSGDSTAATITVDAGPPTVPGGVRVSASPTRSAPLISWSPSSGGPVNYEVRRNGVAFVTVPASITSVPDSSLPLDGSADGTYTYTVVAIDSTGNRSAPSLGADDVVDTTRPAPSTSLAAVSPTAAKPVLVWPAAPGVAGYNVYRGSTKLNLTGLVTGTSFTDSSLVGDGAYTYTVRSVDLAGNESVDSSAAVVVYDTTGPVAPTTTATVGKAAGTATISWTASSDAGAGVSSYAVRRSAANGAAPASPADGTPVCGVLAATALGCSDLGLTPGASYRYSVFAVDAVGNVSSAGQSTAITIPVATDTTPPKAPTGLKSVVADARLTLRWKNPTADLARVVVVWNASRAPRSASDGTSAYKGSGSSFSLKLDKLPAGKKVHFAVFALDKAGNASAAASVTVSVPAAGPLSVAPGGKLGGSPALSWKTIPSTQYYNVQVFEGSGTTKRVGIAWPKSTSYVLPKSDLVKGKTYTWYVWPGIGAKAAAKYGSLIGKQSFTYTG
jgi:large repetitive protein